MKDLTDYKNLPETDLCYLDGRYFNMVFEDYPGLIENPLTIKIKSSKTEESYEKNVSVYMNSTEVDKTEPGLLRVVIETDNSRHSNLLILDYDNGKIYRFEPLGESTQYFDDVNEILNNYLGLFYDLDFEIIKSEIFDERNDKCEKSGYCVAYNIMYALAYINQTEFDPTDVRKFVTLIEQEYGKLPEKGKDVEMGFGNRDGALVGGLSGGLIGGLAFGVPGLVLGGLGGAVIGSTVRRRRRN